MSRMQTGRLLASACLAATWISGQGLGETSMLQLDHPAIQYDTRPLDDRITRLGRDLLDGKVHLNAGGDGFLSSLLKALDVNPDSQTLVFSKTSFQAARIEPRNPRALYFNDDVM